MQNNPQDRKASAATARWGKEQVGSHMRTSFIQLPATLTVIEAINELRNTIRNLENATYIYLKNGTGKLTGVVSFRDILTSSDQVLLADISHEVRHAIDPAADQEEGAKTTLDEDLSALPVVEDGFLVGVLTADQAHEILQEETTEDFQRLSPVTSFTEPLKNASIWLLYRSRVVWLVLLVFGNVFSGAGIAHYEDLIESSVALVFFLPLLIDSGGNAGSQAATLMVRGLATGQVAMSDWLKQVGKEAAVSFLLGLSMAFAVSIVGIVRSGPEIALVVASSMVIIVLVGSLVGMSLPFLLQKFKLDPASASAPLVTSICDGVGVLIYFFIASQILL